MNLFMTSFILIRDNKKLIYPFTLPTQRRSGVVGRNFFDLTLLIAGLFTDAVVASNVIISALTFFFCFVNQPRVKKQKADNVCEKPLNGFLFVECDLENHKLCFLRKIQEGKNKAS
ncbi:CLUMA_CG002713, isoform A [Clunio marinus]|uniref:CLUMA_CG002713, isoform A n=1 Tax=Clunio marinus TaxID=568069 RepID=A0A1J1HNB6_9DIPT|nr:CLUMA_CG002713, isoform A [Clunio marinus]